MPLIVLHIRLAFFLAFGFEALLDKRCIARMLPQGLFRAVELVRALGATCCMHDISVGLASPGDVHCSLQFAAFITDRSP